MFYSLSIVILFESSQEKVARLLLYSICALSGSRLLLGCQCTLLLEAPKPAPLIPCYNSQVNAIIILPGNIVMCWGALLRDVGSLTQEGSKLKL